MASPGELAMNNETMNNETPHRASVNNEQIKIRKAIENDVSAITGILRELGWFAHITSESTTTTKHRINHHFKLCANNSHSIYVAEKPDGEVVGYTAVHWLPYLMLAGPEGYVSELFVRDSERGQGIGTKLLEAVKQEAKERGCSRLSLLNVRYRESYQRGFYMKLGWQEREQVANFILQLA
jgi:GNAT superfamily N-acetyltransferase